jgi:hypothetical protein
MQKDFNIILPEGVKITDIQSTISENRTVATITMCLKEEYTPKNGDFVRIAGNLQEYIAIYNIERGTKWQKQTKLLFHALLGKTDEKLVINDWIFSREVFPATTDEIRKLEEALAKKGKKWNPDKKCIEDLPRWRAENGRFYFYLNSVLVPSMIQDFYMNSDDNLYAIGNYFKTSEAAEKVASQIREIFKNSKADDYGTQNRRDEAT